MSIFKGPKKPETPDQTATRLELEELTAVLLRKIIAENKEFVPPGTGFALFLFDFGAHGNLAYASNGRREDMIRTMREWLSKVED